MKKLFLIFGISLFCAIGIGVVAKDLWHGKTLNAEAVAKRWGKKPFDAKQFREGDDAVRAQQAYSIMTNAKLIGTSTKEIRELFGSPTGFYFIDAYPAYFIQEGKNHKEESW